MSPKADSVGIEEVVESSKAVYQGYRSYFVKKKG